MIYSKTFCLMQMFEFRLQFHWSLFLRFQLTINHHWFRSWLGAVHYLNQCCHSSSTHKCVTLPQWVNTENVQLAEIPYRETRIRLPHIINIMATVYMMMQQGLHRPWKVFEFDCCLEKWLIFHVALKMRYFPGKVLENYSNDHEK